MKLKQLREQQEIDYDTLYELWLDVGYINRKGYDFSSMAAEFDVDDKLRLVKETLPTLHRGMQLATQSEELINRGIEDFRMLVDGLGGGEALEKLARRYKVGQKRQQEK